MAGKGLAKGPMAPTDPLVITMYDDDVPAVRVTLMDWAAQCGTQLSPTAGWGLPVNAIEFTRLGQAERSQIYIFITLAATSVGRGWDSVGHSPGTYINRMKIESLRRP